MIYVSYVYLLLPLGVIKYKSIFTALVTYNWFTKNCTYLMYTV